MLWRAPRSCARRPIARATDYPSKPITLENRAGAGGSIAGAAVARAAPDGYTLLLATGSLLAINVSLYKNIGYDPEKDFEPIGLIGTQTNVHRRNSRRQRDGPMPRVKCEGDLPSADG